MRYYMLIVNMEMIDSTENLIFIRPYESVKLAKRAIAWQRVGGFKDDYRVVKRISKTEFKDVETKEIFSIDRNNRGTYTVDAWENFINNWI